MVIGQVAAGRAALPNGGPGASTAAVSTAYAAAISRGAGRLGLVAGHLAVLAVASIGPELEAAALLAPTIPLGAPPSTEAPDGA